MRSNKRIHQKKAPSMSFASKLASLTRSRRRSIRESARREAALALEMLEDRVVLSTLLTTNPTFTIASAVGETGTRTEYTGEQWKTLAVDSSGDVYAAASTAGKQVYEFAPGGTTPIATYSGFYQVTGLAVDSSNNLYVLDDGGSVRMYAPGSTTPVAVNGNGNYANSVAVDSQGYVYEGSQGGVSVLAPGLTSVISTFADYFAPDIAINPVTGSAAELNAYGSVVNEFAPHSTTVIRTISGIAGGDSGGADGLVYDASGNLYVTN